MRGARFVMNPSNNRNPNSSQLSQDMLMMSGDLNSGMESQNPSSHYYQPKNSGQENRSPQSNNRMSQPQQQRHGLKPQSPSYQNSRQTYNRQSNALDNLEPVNDEMRKRPFTIPVVRVEINCENPMDSSTMKTRQSRIGQ